MTDNPAPKPWDKQPDEPPEWFNRFHIYLTLGPSRTLLAAYHEWSGSKGNHSSTVNKRSKEWRWKERALAFDQANRAEKAAFEAAREAEARERRIRQNDRIFQAVAAALDAADLENLSTEEARTHLPSLRLLYATTSEQQRRELQSSPDHDHLSASSGWPVLDEEARKILERYNDDEE